MAPTRFFVMACLLFKLQISAAWMQGAPVSHMMRARRSRLPGVIYLGATRSASDMDRDFQYHPEDSNPLLDYAALNSTTFDESIVAFDDVIDVIDESNTLGLSKMDRLVNFMFLAVSFGYAIYTILDINHGMTRGWTAAEIATRIPLDNWGNYESALATKPIFTKTTINVVIYLLGDWLSQTTFAGKNSLDFDLSRTLKNGFIGMCFGPLVSYYYQFSDYILPPEDGLLLTRFKKVFMDQTIYLTVKCSIYISAVGLLGGSDWPTVKQSVQDKIVGIVLTAWKFWPLVHCITYSLIPARHRILWVSVVDLGWSAILASMATKPEEAEAPTDPLVASLEELKESNNILVESIPYDTAVDIPQTLGSESRNVTR